MKVTYATKKDALVAAQRKANALGIVLYVERELGGLGWLVVFMVSDPSTAESVLPEANKPLASGY